MPLEETELMHNTGIYYLPLFTVSSKLNLLPGILYCTYVGSMV